MELLDHLPRESFERMVDQAVRVLNVEPQRQFFMSCAGLPEPWAARPVEPGRYAGLAVGHSGGAVPPGAAAAGVPGAAGGGRPGALEAFRRHTGPGELLMADVLMPRLGGMELARRIHELSPHTRTILMSGYAEEVRRDTEALPGGTRFLTKPFLPEQLEAAVEELLPRTSER